MQNCVILTLHYKFIRYGAKVKLVYLEGIGNVPPHFIDVRGKTFGEIDVLELDNIGVNTSGKNIYNYKCRCVCGKILVLASYRLKSEYSCGCVSEFERLPMHCGLKYHGLSGTKTYKIWVNMHTRCHNPNSTGYKRYGGNGITVCERWRELSGKGFLNFLEDMGERPEGKSLNRINGSKIYSKGTCEWATRSEQAFDVKKSIKNTSGKTGVIWLTDKCKWRARITVNLKTIFLGTYKEFEDAVKAREAAELKYYGFIKE